LGFEPARTVAQEPQGLSLGTMDAQQGLGMVVMPTAGRIALRWW
jgi:hypothetical protein